jgi:hypothetical protein
MKIQEATFIVYNNFAVYFQSRPAILRFLPEQDTSAKHARAARVRNVKQRDGMASLLITQRSMHAFPGDCHTL